MSVMRKPRTKITEFEEKDLSIRAIEVRPEILQSRHTTDIGFSRAYAKAMAAGSIFPPVLVFFDGEKYWLADGFTRVHARESLGLSTIRAVIRPGTVEDALLAGIEENFDQYHQRSVTRKDKVHAAELMIRNVVFRTWSDREIARRTGLTCSFLQNMRIRLEKEEAIPLPKFVMRFKDGQLTGSMTKYSKTGELFSSVKKNRKNAFFANVNGKTVYFGADREKAEVKYRKVVTDSNVMTSRMCDVKNFRHWLSRRRVFTSGISSTTSIAGGVCVENCIVQAISEVSFDAFLVKSAKLLFTREFMPGAKRMILVGYIRGANSAVGKLLDPAASLGIEVMTPEEFVAEFGPKDDDDDDDITASDEVTHHE